MTARSRSPASASIPSGASATSASPRSASTAVRSARATPVVGRGGFQAAFCGTVYSGVAAGHKVLTALGLTGVPIVNVEAGCASGGAALCGSASTRSAPAAATRVLVFGMEKMPKGIIRSIVLRAVAREAPAWR